MGTRIECAKTTSNTGGRSSSYADVQVSMLTTVWVDAVDEDEAEVLALSEVDGEEAHVVSVELEDD